jgi:hypothetical protein
MFNVSVLNLSAFNTSVNAITASNVSMFNVSVLNLSAFNTSVNAITASNVSMFNVSVLNLSAFNTSVNAITASNVSMFNVSVLNLSSRNISVNAITASNVSMFNVSVTTFFSFGTTTITKPITQTYTDYSTASGTNEAGTIGNVFSINGVSKDYTTGVVSNSGLNLLLTDIGYYIVKAEISITNLSVTDTTYPLWNSRIGFNSNIASTGNNFADDKRVNVVISGSGGTGPTTVYSLTAFIASTTTTNYVTLSFQFINTEGGANLRFNSISYIRAIRIA